jgi:cellulose synthase operon protein B
MNCMRNLFALGLALMVASQASAQAPIRRPAPPPRHVQTPPAAVAIAPNPAPPSAPPAATPRPPGLLSNVTLGDIGFLTGFRFANLGGHREIFVPVPQSGVTSSELVLVLDDLSAHDARRSLEVLVNDRSAVAIVLDGHSMGRVVRLPLPNTNAKDGFVKLSFLYSGAATQDRCIDVRYVGDSLTIRPETAIELDLGAASRLDVATTAALMPRDVTVVLPGRRLRPAELATALTVARALAASGHHVGFHHGYDGVQEPVNGDEQRRWIRGIVVIGTLDEAASLIDAPVATVAGPVPAFGTLAAIRVAGAPALLVSDASTMRASRLLASPSLAATRGVPAASVGEMLPPELPTDHVTFDQLGVAPAQADVFGRAELTVAIDTRRLPAGMRASRVLLDLMVAPDGAGEKAVVSAYVNEHLLGSTVAASGESTHLDLALPEGLAGTSANVRAVVQRRSAQGDCRFEPQGYPAQILGSSSVVLAPTDPHANDFADISPRWAAGVEVLLPASASEHPEQTLGLVADVLDSLAPENAPINVKLSGGGIAPQPTAPFLAVSDAPPDGATPRVRFDRGRVTGTDRSGRKLLDLGGFITGAVAQIVTVADRPGVWIKPLTSDGTLPAPEALKLDHGDVAFLDKGGVALALSTEHDTLIQISYPDQVSWLTIAERFRSWIVASLWLIATAALLFGLQRMFRRRPADASE